MTACGTLPWMCLLAFALLTEHTSHSIDVAGLSADPPTNIRITDPGHLGYLTIEWNQPSSLQDLTDCTVRYQLRFYDTYTERWRSVRTLKLSYEAQFDLEKPIEVRMFTLVKGFCTNDTEVHGEEVEFVHIPEHIGVPGSRIRDFSCVYLNKEYMDCTWRSGAVDPPGSKHYLYYWHREMEETAECPEYIPSSEHLRGCRFPRESLLEFSEFNICVNGSSAAGELKPAFFTMEVQNKVKPATVSDLQVLVETDPLQVRWSPPQGQVPEQCLEYELEGTAESVDGSERKWTNVTEDTSINFLWNDMNQRNCFRVRSKVNGYCADEGYWSDWSRSVCFPEANVEERDEDPNAIALATVLIVIIITVAALTFGLAFWVLKKMWKNRKEPKQAFTLYQEKVHKALLIPVLP
ncbi:hypothetical protein NFI96_010836 [Prochilodus magdalenae]|nr:hypothetical protein NFI96_010836 [Prochilodus magdalenae]